MPSPPYRKPGTVIRAKAPLRLGFAGGGTDVAPYSSMFGGAVINATIDLFAHATLEILDEPKILLEDHNLNRSCSFPLAGPMSEDPEMALISGVYRHFSRIYGPPETGIRISTRVDVPMGSGLGTSSTLAVALTGAFMRMFEQTPDAMEVAAKAYEIERSELGFAGGHQDQYAAAFGGLNYMEFGPGEHASVAAIPQAATLLAELEKHMVLYFTGHARHSGTIIRTQQENVVKGVEPSVEAMHQLKKQARLMYDTLLAGHTAELGPLFDLGFSHKKKMANGISNPQIESIYTAALGAGATGGKISGAGGGGFMYFFCPPAARANLIQTLNTFTGRIYPFRFTLTGLETSVEQP